jgi:hypothetical protein
MSTQAISVPAIQVNNDTIGLVPNTFEEIPGDGEVNVRAASTGGGNAVSVHTQDAQTMFGKVKFSVYPTTDNVSKIRDWKANVAGNTLTAVQRNVGGKDFSIAFKGMSVTNDPPVKAAADGVIEIEMAGDKIQQ